MKKVISALANDDFTLDLRFEDGCCKKFDFAPYLDFPVFIELKDRQYFRDIKIAFGTVQWRNGQDISPDTLYLEATESKETVEV